MDIPDTQNTEQFSAECEQASGGVRPDKFLTEVFPQLNRSHIKRALQEGQILVNGQVAGKKQKFVEGDIVVIQVPKIESSIPHAVDIPLDIVFEDEDIVVVNKPIGMVTHPGNATGDDTLVHALLAHCDGKLSKINGEDRPGIVHRLDKDTSGIIVAAKTDRACEALLETFRGRSLTKEYLALVSGCPNTQSGVLEAKIARHPTTRTKMAVVAEGKEARTDWEVLETRSNVSLIKCRIHTGRTHQIRVHMSHLGVPVLGDRIYGYQSNRHSQLPLKPGRPLLHACRLVVPHPVTGESMEFKVDPPKDFQAWVDLIQTS